LINTRTVINNKANTERKENINDVVVVVVVVDDDDTDSCNNNNNSTCVSITQLRILPTCFILCLQISNTVYAYYTLLKNVVDS
jgi:hypothetical protein